MMYYVEELKDKLSLPVIETHLFTLNKMSERSDYDNPTMDFRTIDILNKNTFIPEQLCRTPVFGCQT